MDQAGSSRPACLAGLDGSTGEGGTGPGMRLKSNNSGIAVGDMPKTASRQTEASAGALLRRLTGCS